MMMMWVNEVSISSIDGIRVIVVISSRVCSGRLIGVLLILLMLMFGRGVVGVLGVVNVSVGNRYRVSNSSYGIRVVRWVWVICMLGVFVQLLLQQLGEIWEIFEVWYVYWCWWWQWFGQGVQGVDVVGGDVQQQLLVVDFYYYYVFFGIDIQVGYYFYVFGWVEVVVRYVFEQLVQVDYQCQYCQQCQYCIEQVGCGGCMLVDLWVDWCGGFVDCQQGGGQQV